MPLFIMATKLNGDGNYSVSRLEAKETRLARAIEEADLDIEWIANYTTAGPYNYIDIFRAPNCETAMKVNILVRNIGNAHSEIWGTMEWQRFKDILHELPDTA